MIVCGVDDAGRGSMAGPLVIAGVSISKSKLRKLSSIGVKDSKKLSPKSRDLLYEKIIEFADSYYVVKINPKIIDKSVQKHGLNDLEAKYMAKVISKLHPDESYVDSCDVNPKRFGKLISGLSKNSKVHSHHHADSKFVIVSAASILAKVTRDKEIEKLKKNYDLGSGYPSDAKTVSFVHEYYSKNQVLPEFIRKSWKPIKDLVEKT